MTNWKDPLLQLAECLALIKLVHVLAGLYIWEFILNLDFEISVLMGKRKFARTLPLYVGCRWCTLAAIIIQLVGINMSTQIDCKALVIFAFIFAYLSFLFAAGLVILRIYALWERSMTVLLLSSALWIANTVAFIYNAVVARGRRVGEFCEVDHLVETRVAILSTFTTDLVLLALMLSGVLRWKEGRQKGGIWWVLYKQGLLWVLVFTLADIPPVILIILNLNGASHEPGTFVGWNVIGKTLTKRPTSTPQMFMVPGMIVMSIGALRMHRGLVNSPALNSTLSAEAAGGKGPSTMTEIRFGSSSPPNSREEGVHVA
ncbi:hypothetical protein F5148DRAFT_1286458 [Russula earlei]|uniref:Uncharacterized protein n=1 Tax=Russula earlei TaxID=71964 RepID=A0ACC0U4J7_9AGAM|nr:hypothetical protein F5148DRAFT_1286458 [Russula earlei]